MDSAELEEYRLLKRQLLRKKFQRGYGYVHYKKIPSTTQALESKGYGIPRPYRLFFLSPLVLAIGLVLCGKMPWEQFPLWVTLWMIVHYWHLAKR